MIDLTSKNILITGASSGIGRVCAIEAAKHGAVITLLARNEDKLREVKNQLPGKGHQIVSHDLTEINGYEEIIRQLVEKNGKFHGLIHSAGIELTLPFKTTRPDHFSRLYFLNVIAGFELARIISKKKYIDSSPSFVFISSVRGVVGEKGNSAYCSSKGALISGVKGIALELAAKQIRVNSVSPGLVKTPMIEDYLTTLSPDALENLKNQYPLGLGEPLDVAQACCFLLSGASRWITGSNLIIDGGFTCR